MFETNLHSIFSFANDRNAVLAIRGPRCDPPMPIFTIASIGLPVAPIHLPDRTRRENSLALSSSSLITRLLSVRLPFESRRAV